MEIVFKIIEWGDKRYSVSNTGLVFNNKTGKYISLSINKDGYCNVNLYYGKGRYKTFRVHRLVAIAFIQNPENKPMVNHKNGVRHDNIVENLEWATLSEQQAHSYSVLKRIGAMVGRPSHLNSNAKRVIAKFQDGSTKEYGSLRDACKELKLIYTNASRVLRRKQNHTNHIKLEYGGK